MLARQNFHPMCTYGPIGPRFVELFPRCVLLLLILSIISADGLNKIQKTDRRFIKLRHPQTGQLAVFVYAEDDKKLYQMRSLPFSHR